MVLAIFIISVSALFVSLGFLLLYLRAESRKEHVRRFEFKKLKSDSETKITEERKTIAKLRSRMAEMAKEHQLHLAGTVRDLKVEIEELRRENEKLIRHQRIFQEELAHAKANSLVITRDGKRVIGGTHEHKPHDRVLDRRINEPVISNILRDYFDLKGFKPKGNSGNIAVPIVIILMIISIVGIVYGLMNLYVDLKTKERDLSKVMSDIGATETRGAEYEKLVTNLRVSLDNSLKENSDLSEKLKRLTDNFDSLQKTLADRNSQIGFLSAERERLQKTLGDQTAADQARLTALQSEKGTLESTLNDEKQKAAKLQDDMRGKIRTLEQSIGKLNAEKDNIEKNMSKLHHDSLVVETEKMHFNLANHFLESRKYDLAIKEYERAIMLRPDDLDAHYNLALVYDIYTEKYSDALEHYKRVLEINPKYGKRKDIEERIALLEMQHSANINPTVAQEEQGHDYNPDSIVLKDE